MLFSTKPFTLILAATLALSAQTGMADPKPKGGKRVSAATLQQLYVGKTHIWSKGGIYRAPNGTFQQVWDGSAGFGTYKIDNKGRLCKKVYYLDGGQAHPETKAKGDMCIWHLQTPDGAIWVNDYDTKSNAERKNEWWKIVSNGKATDKLKSGNKISGAYNRATRKDGLNQKALKAEGRMKPITNANEFLAQVQGKTLYVTKSNYLAFQPNGTYAGQWKGKPFSATWKWKGRHLCRVLDGRKKEDCQEWKGNGTYFKVVGSKGKGSFWYINAK